MADSFHFYNTTIHFLGRFEPCPCDDKTEAEPLWDHCGREVILRDLAQWSAGMRLRLRALLLENGAAGLYRLSDQDVLTQLAERIERGAIRVVQCREALLPAAGRAAGAGLKDSDSETPALPPSRRPPPSSKKEKTWIEVRLVDSSGKPVAGAAYKLKLTDGRVEEGSLDSNGAVRVEDIDPGICQLTFPELDAGDWEAA